MNYLLDCLIITSKVKIAWVIWTTEAATLQGISALERRADSSA
jgi:hypothetical protein